MRRPDLHLRVSAFVEYETFILNPDGSVARRRARKRNLIYDQGLNQVATSQWAACFANCAVGTGTRAVKRDSGAITFSRSGSTVTASAGFFESADVGRLIKFDTGEEMRVTAYTDTQNVTVNVSGTLGASEGTVWYVNDTGHETETARTSTVTTAAGDCETQFSVDTYTHKRTFLFPAVGGAVTYREIGWSPTASAGANLFGRDLIPGGDSLSTGQQYKVIVRLFLTISPVSITAQADVGNNGYDTAGTYNHQYILTAYSAVNSSGATVSGGLEPAVATGVVPLSSTFSLLTSPSYTDQSSGIFVGSDMTNAAYTNGNFYRDSSITFDVSTFNGSHYGFCFGLRASGNPLKHLMVLFTATQTKDSSHNLTITLRKSWGRILAN